MEDNLYKVIAVDDEIWALRGLCNIVDWESMGFSIVGSYTNPKEALENIASKNPDVVFTDIRMPGIDGMGLIESVHNMGASPHLVIVSAYRDFDVAKRAISKKVTDYLMKPLDKKEVAELLGRLKLSLDKERKDRVFDIMHYDLSQPMDRNNPEVVRYLEQLSVNKSCYMILSEVELLESELVRVYVKGFAYAYICSDHKMLARITEDAKGRIGISREYQSFTMTEELLSDATDSFEGDFLFSENRKIADIEKFLCGNFEKKLSPAEVAAHFFVSESYLFELFRKNTETSVLGLLKNVRLSKAALLLKEGGHTVTEIADMVGYSDVGYFGRHFKAKFGCTPEQWGKA